jgi:LPS export ABC transporter protein LptC
MRRNTLLAILLILTLAIGSRWLVVQNQPPDEPTAAEIDTRFDYALSGFKMRAYDADGLLAAVLEAPTLSQEAISMLGDIDHPRLRLPGQGRGDVELNADSATISSDKNQISFTGAVSLQHQSEPGSLTTMTTTRLVYDIAANTVRSNKEVHMERAGMQMTGTGLEMNLQEQRYRLLSDVEGSYER